MRKMINFIAFQVGWFSTVLGAAHGMPWLGVIVVPAALAIHLALSPDWRPELLLALCAAVMGFLIDSALIVSGVFSPVPFLFPARFSAFWMLMLWLNLATIINVSRGWLRGRYFIAAILGAIGGPMAYYSGAKLGAMTRLPGLENLLLIGMAWAASLPIL
jgi:hypothetical protein